MVKTRERGTLAAHGQLPWPVVPLINGLTGQPRYGIGAAAVPFSPALPEYIRITDITSDGHYSPAPPVSVDHPRAMEYLLQTDDIVLARTGASVGKSYRHRGQQVLVFAGFLIRVRCDREILDPRFLAAFLDSRQYWSWVRRESVRSGQPGLSSTQFAAMPIPLPPISEQQRIGAMLADFRELLDSLAELIDKKRAIRLAVMQELLGAPRPPRDPAASPLGRKLGFESQLRDSWDHCALGEVVRCSSGGTPRLSVSGNWGGDIPWISGASMHGVRLSRSDRTLTELGARSGTTVCAVGSTLILVRGMGILNDVRVGHADVPLAFNQDVKALEPLPQLDGWFLTYSLLARREEILSLIQTAGHGTGTLPTDRLLRLQLRVPNLSEQQRIAECMRDIDDEITALESRRDKLGLVYAAVLEDLLTGVRCAT